jgi:hypothetical protein
MVVVAVAGLVQGWKEQERRNKGNKSQTDRDKYRKKSKRLRSRAIERCCVSIIVDGAVCLVGSLGEARTE